MRLLMRARCDRRFAEAIELALVAEGLALPRRENDLQRFEEARLTLLVRDTERVVRARAAAAADPEVEPSLAQMIERRDLAGDAERMVQRQQLHGRPHAQAARAGHDPARHEQGRRQDRTGGVDQHLGQPHDVEPPLLSRVGELEQLLEPLALRAAAPYLLREDSEVHALSLLRPEPIAAAGPPGAIVLRRRPCRQGARARQHSSFRAAPPSFWNGPRRLGYFPPTYPGFSE